MEEGRKGVGMVPSQKTPSQARAESDLYFGPFRLESSKQLWRGKQLVSVRPRPLAVLRYLLKVYRMRDGLTLQAAIAPPAR